MRRVIGLGVAVALVTGSVALGACRGGEESGDGGGQPAASASPDVLLIELDDFYIDPEEIQGRVGQTYEVTAFSEGQQKHTLTIDELGVDREFPPSDTQIFPLTLPEAGEFKVYCRFHAGQGMTATLTVSE